MATPTDAVSPVSARIRARSSVATSRPVPSRRRTPRDVDERLVDRQLLDERGDDREDRHHLVALLGVAIEPRRQEHAVRAGAAGAPRRHRGVDAERARFVARRAHDAPVPGTADDHRLGRARSGRRAARPTRRTRRGRRAGSLASSRVSRGIGYGAADDAHRRRGRCRAPRTRTHAESSGSHRSVSQAHSGSRTHGAHDASRSVALGRRARTPPRRRCRRDRRRASSPSNADGEVHLAAHPPAHVGRERVHLVERPAPLADARARSLPRLRASTRRAATRRRRRSRRRACSSPRSRRGAGCARAARRHPSRRGRRPPSTRGIAGQSRARTALGTIPPRGRARPACASEPARRVGLLALAFAGILVAGAARRRHRMGHRRHELHGDPTVGDQLSTAFPASRSRRVRATPRSLGGTLVGAAIAAVGAGVVAGLMLRAQSEWRAHPPGVAATGVTRSADESGGTPRHT